MPRVYYINFLKGRKGKYSKLFNQASCVGRGQVVSAVSLNCDNPSSNSYEGVAFTLKIARKERKYTRKRDRECPVKKY